MEETAARRVSGQLREEEKPMRSVSETAVLGRDCGDNGRGCDPTSSNESGEDIWNNEKQQVRMS